MKTENSNTEYYGYFVTHSYMSQIQRGIQSAHVIQVMYEKYHEEDTSAAKIFKEWMINHRTMIVLNGGNSNMIRTSFDQSVYRNRGNKYPIASFAEDELSMEGMVTAWGVILPKFNLDQWEYEEFYGCYYNTYTDSYPIEHEDIYLTVLKDLKLA